MLLRGHGGQPVFRDEIDRAAFLAALQTAFTAERVALHAYALLPERVWLLCTPASSQGIGRAVQSLGRGFSASFNRRHGRTGTVWDGRYRAAVIEDGLPLLEAMVFVDQAPVREGQVATPLASAWSSARQHAGIASQYVLTDAETYWMLGNTPFERWAAYRTLVEEMQGNAKAERLATAALRGWAIGSQSFLERTAKAATRPVTPRPRGRPRLKISG